MRSWIHCLTIIFVSLGGSTVAQEPTAEDPWASSVGAGFALTRGNTDTQNYNASFTTKYDSKRRFVFKADALWLRGSSDGETQVDRASAAARGEYTLSERTFTFAEVSYLRDPFRDIGYLIGPVAGAGYRVIVSEVRNLTVDAAAGMLIEENTLFGRTTSGSVKAGEDFEWKLSETSRITQKLTGLWRTDDFGDAYYHFDAGLVTAILTRLELKIAYAYDHQTRPQSAEIEKGDSALFAALVYKF